ncbi:MAG: hypothetical protein Q4P17_10755 [Methanobacterium sp.]|nr:hypothetical protein [Methanobacterium sp.]
MSNDLLSIDEKRRYKSLCNRISKEYSNVENSSLKISFYLYEIYKKKYFSIGDFKNIYDFAYYHFGLSRATCNNFINVIEKFALKDESGNVILNDENKLIDGFERFAFSKLCLLVSVNLSLEDILKIFDPVMSARTIREKKRELKGLSAGSDKVEIDDEDEIEEKEKKKPVKEKPNQFVVKKMFKDDFDKILNEEADKNLFADFNKMFDSIKAMYPDKNIEIEISIVC